MTVMTNEGPADPSVHEPRVTGSPAAIWLVYGDLEHDDTHGELCSHEGVTWCEDSQFPADVRYVRADLAAAELAALRREAAELRELLKTAGQWITSALPTLDTIEPECSTEAELLTALIRSGEMLVLSTRHRGTTGPIGAPIAPEHVEALNALSEAAVEKQREMMRNDARYRWLRAQHWSTSPLCVVADPKESVKLARTCPSGEYLDIAIDAAMQEQPR